jgi:hypothetical protein
MGYIFRLKGNNMVIQELTWRAVTIETAICNSKWESRDIGQLQERKRTEREDRQKENGKRGQRERVEMAFIIETCYHK